MSEKIPALGACLPPLWQPHLLSHIMMPQNVTVQRPTAGIIGHKAEKGPAACGNLGWASRVKGTYHTSSNTGDIKVGRQMGHV